MKIDLHTHSIGSPDGGLTAEDYRNVLESKCLDYVAITDHGTIEAALVIKQQLGVLENRIIIGEEIKTSDGELIGLYLKETIPERMSLAETVAAIRRQGGLVYVPHPFETVRSGVSKKGFETIADLVDIIEVYNGRAYFQNRGFEAMSFAEKYGMAVSAASDAHGRHGWGITATIVNEPPTQENLKKLITNGTLQTRRVGLGILYPKFNRLKKKLYV